MNSSEHGATRMRNGLIAFAILALAGCSAPTSPNSSEARPSFDGGMISVGGGRASDDSTSSGGMGPEAQPTGTGIWDPKPIDDGLLGN